MTLPLLGAAATMDRMRSLTALPCATLLPVRPSGRSGGDGDGNGPSSQADG